MIDEHGRTMPPQEADEVATLCGFLDYQRQTLMWKCARLGDEELQRSLPPTTMTLAGLVVHMAYVEDYWFTQVVDEAEPPAPWSACDWDADPDAEWHLARTLPRAEIETQWQTSLHRARAVVDHEMATFGIAALDRTHPAWDGAGTVSLRWVLVHMIEEYARHNGHADLLRQAIDGEVGE